MHYPLTENHGFEPVLEPHRTSTICNVWMMVVICGYTAYDIMLAYSSSPCYAADIPTYPFSLSMWLHISGYMGLTLILFHALYQYRDASPYRRTIILCHDILILLLFMWNILGIVILWMHYADYMKCSVNVVIYMVFRITIGILINFLQLYIDYREWQL